MSYILDALRKSEQQRQATQPETVTDRILINQPQPQPKRKLWLITLLISNLLLIGGLAWYFSRQTIPTTNQQINLNNLSSAEKTVKPQTVVAPAPVQVNRAQPERQTPSIAQLIETQKTVQTPKFAKKAVEKKQQSVKKEYMAKAATPRVTPEPASEEPINEPPSRLSAKPKIYGTPDVNELPSEARNNLPNLNINVFSYAHQPEERFVIIDMVKYKTGQLVKGQVKLKEIRADSIVLENTNGSTFKVERP